ncbi:MAG: hypothetical protein N3G19_02835 [Candidatus Pacearchaeota archaeon]|nr:hypothetical protein [Candidatus Pacearchaeota archaeon]
MSDKRGKSSIMNKKAQVTLFIIIAIVVVAIIILAFILVPRLFPREKIAVKPTDPEAYIQDCINLALEPAVKLLASQGGYLELGNCIFYKNVCRHYLCYTNTPYPPCVNQEPLLKEKIESILKTKLQQNNVVSNCIVKFQETAKKQGYDVSVCASPTFSVNLTEGKVNVPIKCEITIAKGEEVKRFEKLEPYLKWPLFEFVMLAKQIINEEITNTDFDPIAYMVRHYLIEIEKFRTSDDSKIYTLRERASGKEFVFAIRNYVLPPGIL